MKFQFNVKFNDQDYLDYNTFWMIRSPYGKKQIKTFRITISVLFVIFISISLFSGGFSLESILGVIPMLIILSFAQIFLTRFFSWSLKGQIKTLKKSGKMGYSPESIIEFYEDSFVETTPENKTEHKYSAIERISVVDNKMIYIHVNNVMSYMLPLSSFESKEQYDSFFEFIKTKCANIDIY
ncbi:MAG: YcxB family protein [Oscillospiraceae bacterium]|nr:YcxB family protein [Oscillospiraceae bacterium]